MKVSLWDVTQPSLRMFGDPLTDESGGLSAIAFSPDGQTLATGSAPADGGVGKVRLWDVSDPTRPASVGRVLIGPRNEVASIAFSPDGKALAAGFVPSASSTGPGGLRIWDTSAVVDLREKVVRRACQQVGGLSRSEWQRIVPNLRFTDPC